MIPNKGETLCTYQAMEGASCGVRLDSCRSNSHGSMSKHTTIPWPQPTGILKLELVRAQLQGIADGFVHKSVLSTTKGCLLTDTLELSSLGSKEGSCNASHSIDP